MTCCGSPGVEEEFTAATAARTLRRWRARGLLPRERALLDPVVAQGVTGAHVLEVGGGLGQLQVALLHAGAASATNLELASAYEPDAAALLAEEGLADRVERRVVDAADPDVVVRPADVVLCFRALCCTADWRGMVATLLRARPRVLAVTLPRGGWLPAAVVAAENTLHRLRGRSFRMRHHPCDEVVAQLGATGLAVVHDAAGPLWRTVVLTAPA